MLKLENSIRGLSFSRVAFDLTIQGTKIIALFRNNSVDALYHITHLSSYCVDSSPNFAK